MRWKSSLAAPPELCLSSRSTKKRHGLPRHLSTLPSSQSAIQFDTISQSVIACLNAATRAVAGKTAGRRVIGTDPAITLHKNDATIIDFKSTGVVIGQRRSAHGQDRDRCNQEFHFQASRHRPD
jgi:hypothetical protein